MSNKRPFIPFGTPAQMTFWQRNFATPRIGVYADELLHARILGTTKSGKTSLVSGIQYGLAKLRRAGSIDYGWSDFDPHHDGAEDRMNYYCAQGYFQDEEFLRRFIYVPLSDNPNHPYAIGLNTLAKKQPIHLIISDNKTVIRRAFPTMEDAPTPVIDTFLAKSIPVLVENSLPLTALERLLTDQKFRDPLVHKCSDFSVKNFWFRSFNQMKEWERADDIQSTMRRLGLLTSNPLVKACLSCPTMWPVEDIINDGMIAYYDVGMIQDYEAQQFIICALLTAYERAIFSRIDLPPSQRRRHLIFCDEFSRFDHSHKMAERILVEARKFQGFFVMCSQFLSQTDKIAGALQNVDMVIAMRTGEKDARLLAEEIGKVDPTMVLSEAKSPSQHAVYQSPQLQYSQWQQRLSEQAPREAWVKRPGKPAIQIRTLDVPQVQADPNILEHIKQFYRDKYMTKWDQIDYSFEEESVAPQPLRPKPY